MVVNLVYTQQTINLEIKAFLPQEYMQAIWEQTNSSTVKFGTITNEELLKKNLEENNIPLSIFRADHTTYEDFLAERRKRMARKIKMYYENL